MSRIEKRISKWKNHQFKQDVPVDDLFSVLDYFFPGSYKYGETRGSHIIKVWHECLKGVPGFGPDGDFTIPTKGGKKVKHFYLKDLVKAIDIVRECK